MIDVVDYGIGNFGSVIRMIEKVGGSAKLISTPEEIMRAEKIILPGVGHFDRGMSQILERGLLEPLRFAGITARLRCPVAVRRSEFRTSRAAGHVTHFGFNIGNLIYAHY